MQKAFSHIRLFAVLWHLPVGLSLASLYYLTCRWTGRSFSTDYAWFLISAGAAGYTLMRLYHLKQQRALVRDFYRRHLYATLLFLLTASATALAAWIRTGLSFRLLAVPAVFSLFYNLRTGNKWLSWREWGAFKILIVALVWAALTVYVPSGGRMQVPFYTAAATVLWVLMLIIPFDIRDLSLDEESLKTLPRLFREKTPAAGFVLYTLFLAVVFAAPYGGCVRYAWAGGGLLSLTAILRASRYEDRFFYTALGVESIPVLTALAAWLICR